MTSADSTKDQIQTRQFNISETDYFKRLGVILQMAQISQKLSRFEFSQLVECSEESTRLWERGVWLDDEELRWERFNRIALLLNQNPQIFTKLGTAPQFFIYEGNPYKRQGLILRMARIAQDMTCKDLGAVMSLSDFAILRRERGETAIDSLEVVKFARTLNQDVRLFWS